MVLLKLIFTRIAALDFWKPVLLIVKDDVLWEDIALFMCARH